MVNDLKDIIKDFKNLASKIQTDNSNVKQHLKDKNLMLEACQKEYQKIYFEHENLKKKNQQLEEQLKQQQQQQQQQRQRLIKNLPRCIKNKKRYFITDVNENENDYKNDDYKNDDDNYDDKDDEVEYIKVKKRTNKKNVQSPKKKQKKYKKE